LAQEQRTLRRQMESRFRAAFPDAIAVVDPVLQMRRKISEARHAAGQPDSGDFLPMIQKVMAAIKDVPAGALRIVSYENGRMTLEVATKDESVIQRIAARLVRSGLTVDPSAPARPGGPTATITVRSS
jgi:general secretion pathway protein L